MWCGGGVQGAQLRSGVGAKSSSYSLSAVIRFPLGFAVRDLFHVVIVFGLALEVFGPVGVAEMCGAVQGTP